MRTFSHHPRSCRALLALLCLAIACGRLRAGEVIDRIMAVVLQQPILLSDVNGALSLKLIEVPPGTSDPVAMVLDRLIERTLILGEVDRYQPPEPATPEIDSRVKGIEERVGTPEALNRVMAATGMTQERLRQYVRDDLRLSTYLNQRFGASSQPSDAELQAYYREHAAEFTTNGKLQPFEAVAPAIRERLTQARRATLVSDWTASLRRRADVTVLYVPK
jgi:hypothetical protein